MKRICCLAVVVAMQAAASSQAAVPVHSGNEVIGVADLVVGNGIYDAIFTLGTYNDLLADYPPPTYQTNYTSEFAEAATWALYDFAVSYRGFADVSVGDIRGCESSATGAYLSTSVAQNSLNAWSFSYQGDGLAWGGPNYYPYHIYPSVDVAYLTHVVWQQTGTIGPPPLFGDANNDGVVSADDFAAVQANFGSTGSAVGFLLGDANDDGVVSADDFAAIQSQFGTVQTTSVPVAPIPEPASGLLVSTSLFALIRASRRNRAAQ